MRRRYGAHPLHLAGHAVVFAMALFAAVELAGYREPRNLLIWVLAAVVLHDLLLLPLYSGLDRALRRVAATNYVRIPAALSALTFLVFFPLILGRSDRTFERNAGYDPGGYLERWLIICALLFAGSAVVYGVRRLR